MRATLKKIVWYGFSLCVIGVVVLLALILYLEAGLPNVQTLKNIQLQEPLRIYTEEGKLIAEYGAKRRSPVEFNQLPKTLVNATVATEDGRFFSHAGVDLFGLARAAVVLVTTGHKAEGGSTITMQVARNYFLTRKKTYIRKIREILLALKISHSLPKEKVLELYFNKIFYGNRAYGIQAAAYTYYGKSVNQLNLAQVAMLAGLPKAPSTLNPLYNPRAALDRRNHVLGRMLDQKYITQAAYQAAIKAPITATYHGPRVEVRAPYVAAMVQQAIYDKYGSDAYDRGFNVYTTIQARDQKAANRAVFNGLMAYDRRHGYRGPMMSFGSTVPTDLTQWQDRLLALKTLNHLRAAVVIGLTDQEATVLLASGRLVTLPWQGLSWARGQYFDNGQEYLRPLPKTASDILKLGDVVRIYQGTHWWLAQKPEVEAALVAMNPQTGAIRALIGGFTEDRGQFNRALQAERQPGSSFKPFIYSAALAKGFTLASRFNDAPVVLEGGGQLWRPENDTHQFYGMVSLASALTYSRNLVSIRLLQLIGIPYAIDYATRFGFSRDQLPDSLSLALGTASVTPLQMTAAYAVFASGGYKTTTHLIDKVTLGDGQLFYQATLPQACEACLTDPNAPLTQDVAPQVITPQNAYLMTLAMQAVIRTGTGQAARYLHRTDLAGKTGTTNDKRDAWFCGYNHHLVATVWVGFDQSRTLYEFGNQAALPIWIDFMRDALKNTPAAMMPEPPGLVRVRINPNTGKLAAPGDPNAVFETFRKRYVPKAAAHEAAPLRGDSHEVTETLEQEVY